MQQYFCCINRPMNGFAIPASHPVMAAIRYANNDMPAEHMDDLVTVTVIELDARGHFVTPFFKVNLALDLTDATYYPA
jgi:hypothetical protein